MPISFAGKLKYLQGVEKDEFWTNEQRAETREIRLALGQLNGTRKELFHGLVYMTGLSEHFVVHVAKEEGNELIRRTVETNYAELMDFRDELMRMINRLTDLYDPILGVSDEG